MSSGLIYLGAAIWIVGIPIAFGFASKEGSINSATDPVLWLVMSVFWPGTVLVSLALMALWGLWSFASAIVKGLFRFGGRLYSWLFD